MDQSEMIKQMLHNLEVMIDKFVSENEEIKSKRENAESLLNFTCEAYNNLVSDHRKLIQQVNGCKPVKVYHHRKRRNTTVKFADGSSVTVTRAKGDKDCLETAIVYALFKKNYDKKILEELVENAEIIGRKRRCKKN